MIQFVARVFTLVVLIRAFRDRKNIVAVRSGEWVLAHVDPDWEQRVWEHFKRISSDMTTYGFTAHEVKWNPDIKYMNANASVLIDGS
jgi:hypothetical protein